MGEMAVEGQGSEGQEEVVSVAPEGEGGSGLNPAWNDLMQVVPSQLHSQVTPHLQQWDKNYQEGINKVHSQYEPYKPYLENNVAPDQINYALQLMQAIETRPDEVMAALKDYLGVQEQSVEQGQPEEEEIPQEFLNHPEFQKISKMVETMAQLMVQQNQSQQQSQADQELEAELTSLTEKHGEFDIDWVLTKAMNDPEKPLEDHVLAFREFEKGLIAKQRQPGPKVLSAGGVAPNNQVDPKSLDGKGRRSLIADMLAAAQQQSG